MLVLYTCTGQRQMTAKRKASMSQVEEVRLLLNAVVSYATYLCFI